MSIRVHQEKVASGTPGMRTRDFVRGIAVFPVAGLACWLMFWLGRDSRGWASHGWALGLLLPLLAASVLAIVGTIWTLVAGLMHKTFKISALGLLLGLLLVRIAVGVI